MPIGDTLVPLDLPPGIYKTGTIYQAKGRWGDGDLVRFFQGTKGPIGGWQQRTLTGDAILGEPNAAIAWRPDIPGMDTEPVIVVGTTKGLYAIIENNVTDITPTLVASQDDEPGRHWILDIFGQYLMATANVVGDTTKSRGPFYWTNSGIAVPIEGETAYDTPPSYPYALVTTPERFLFLLGGFDPRGPFAIEGPNPPQSRTVFWPDQETFTVWQETDTGTAGQFPLPSTGTLVCGRRTRGGVLLLTTTDAFLSRYVGLPLVYGFEQVGDACGAVAEGAANCMAVLDTFTAWMGSNDFFEYDGFVKPIPCDVHDHVFGDFNRDDAHKVWAFANPFFGEVTWFYPSAASNECDKYVTYNMREKHWSIGSLGRGAGVSEAPDAKHPLLFDKFGALYDHETGQEMGGRTPYLESGPLELDTGDNLLSVQRLVPDDKTVGDVSLTVYGGMDPDAAETAYGPYPISVQTWVRIKARQFRMRFTQVRATAWRIGTMRFGIVKSSRR